MTLINILGEGEGKGGREDWRDHSPPRGKGKDDRENWRDLSPPRGKGKDDKFVGGPLAPLRGRGRERGVGLIGGTFSPPQGQGKGKDSRFDWGDLFEKGVKLIFFNFF